MPSASNPMQQAVFRGCVECIRMLVETPPYYSVDSCCGPDGLRPIHIATREGHIQTLRFLSSAGACLQRSDFNGFTALHHGAITGQLRAVRWLLRHGAKILLDKRGRSPIQVAADHDHMEIVNVLAKHATATNGTTLNNKDSSQTLVKSTSNNSSNNNTNSEANRTSRRSDTEDTKDRSNLTTENIDENYSLSQSNNTSKTSQNNSNCLNPKPFSHLHLSPEADSSFKASSSPGDCASSSGNSSLTASTSAPSLSPSASSSSATSCSCSTSDETTLLKSIVEVSDSFTLEEYQSKTPTAAEQRSSLVSSPAPFFLHPPKDKGSDSPQNTQLIDFDSNDNIGSVNGTPVKKKSNHKRQDSIASNSPFFLHPPENLVNETQTVVAKMAPTPVNPSHSHHHFADPINEPTPKMKVSLPGDSSSSSSSSSPPLTPPSQKSCLSASTVSSCLNKFQQQDNCQKKREIAANNKCPSSPINTEATNTEVKVKNQLNTNENNCVPPPPPLPPPLPFSSSNNNLVIAAGNGIHFYKESDNRNSSPTKQDILETENDYEDIDELTNGTNHYEQARKLLRSVSAPPPMNENGLNGQSSEDKQGPPALPERIVVPNRPPIGCGKPGVPFIPPHFPTPLHDALIKPSEYLRSIQNKTKTNGNNNNVNANGGSTISRPSTRVEEALKALGVHDNHMGLMSPVPEETNAEDEFEEINPERINGFIKVNGQENSSPETNPNQNSINGSNGTVVVEENNNRGYGMIKPEELLKVHLRKTPMSRTKSAPPLGRVIPDDQVPSQNCSQENGHEPLKRTNTTATNGSNYGSTGNGNETGTVSKAAVIAELAESSQVGGVREWKEELRRRQKEQDKHVQKEIEQFYQPVNFVAEVPATDVTGAPIPDWKRQMMAKKAAERAKREAEEQRRLEIEAKRMASIPIWRRQLLQRRESDGKYAQ